MNYKSAPLGQILLAIIGIAALGVFAATDSTDVKRNQLSEALESAQHKKDMSLIAEQFWGQCRTVVSGDPNETAAEVSARYANGQPDYVSGSLIPGRIIRDDLTGEPLTPGTPVCDRANGGLSFLDDESRVTEVIINLSVVGELDGGANIMTSPAETENGELDEH